jgi:hypothetical protein
MIVVMYLMMAVMMAIMFLTTNYIMTIITITATIITTIYTIRSMIIITTTRTIAIATMIIITRRGDADGCVDDNFNGDSRGNGVRYSFLSDG